MKSKIRFSGYVTVLTACICVALFIGCIATIHNRQTFFILLFSYIVLLLFGLLYGAAYIKADRDYILMGSLVRSRKIQVSEIESIELFRPTMDAQRIIGSGGFMGYWGIFREGDIGRYYAFYGKASDCFLVRMSNGDKYILGCENPDAMVRYIRSQMKQEPQP